MVCFDTQRFRGMRVYVIGGGPSLIGLDLETDLHFNMVVGCNDAYKLSCTKLCCFGDNTWGRTHQDRLIEWISEGNEVWTNNNSWQFSKDVNWLRKCPHLSTHDDCAAWFGNTGFLGLQLALLGNPDEVVLLGYDMCLIDGRSNWHDDNRGQPRPCDYDTMLKHTDEIIKEVEEKYRHVRVLNANPLSRLEGFDVVDPESVGIHVPTHHIYSRSGQ